MVIAAVGIVVSLGLQLLIPAGPPPKLTVQVTEPALSAEAARGKATFEKFCRECHGPSAGGSDQGPPLVHRIYHPDHHADGAFLLAVRNGVRRHHWPFGDMPPRPEVSQAQAAEVARYVRELQQANGIF
ncbi:MAG: cytochrome c [Hyphomicrobiales bacterium]|nr:cytochrome c [Hyphomicrobiales bacterium]